MMWRLYDLLATLVVPLSLPFFALHPRLRGGVRQRLGVLPAAPPAGVWFHGASAGDLNALLPIAASWRATGGAAYASAFTRSGVERLAHADARQLLGFFAPLDVSLVLRRVFSQLAPRALVIEHLELWPGLFAVARRASVPVALVNARVSAQHARRYRRFKALFSARLADLALVVAASEQDAQRFVELGVSADRVGVAEQSTKHATVDPAPCVTPRSPCAVFGSVHPREERLLLPILRQVAADGTQIIVAPRHPHRASALARRVARLGLRVRLASQQAACGAAPEVEILDRIGQLPHAYRRATVAFVGGSLEPRGGHNVLEAACQGCSVVTGPFVDACAREVAALQRAGVARVASDVDEVLRWIRAWRDDDLRRAEACRAVAGEVARQSQQVVGRVVRWLEGLG